MGIPSYFSYILKRLYEILYLTILRKVDNLYLDSFLSLILFATRRKS